MKRLLLVAFALAAVFAARPAMSADLEPAQFISRHLPLYRFTAARDATWAATLGPDGRLGPIQIQPTIQPALVNGGPSWEMTSLPAVRSAVTIRAEHGYSAFRGWAIGPR